MGASRLSMRKLRETLRLKYEARLPHRAIARACGIGLGTVSEYVQRASEAGLSWPLPADLEDVALERRLFTPREPGRERIAPDVAHLHRELKRQGVTLHLQALPPLARTPRVLGFCSGRGGRVDIAPIPGPVAVRFVVGGLADALARTIFDRFARPDIRI